MLPLSACHQRSEATARPNVYKSAISFIFFLSFLIQGFNVYACTCPPLEKISKAQTDAYNSIFTGKVDSVTLCAGQMSKAWFTVYELYNGDVPQRISVNFDCVSDCRMQLKPGEEWLVYARYAKFGDLRIEFCSRSRKHTADVNEDYSIAANGMTWDEEIQFLMKTYGVKPTGVEREVVDSEMFNRELLKPKGMQIIWLLVVSLAVMGGIWLVFKKLWK
jgi:hypothetical protein